MQKTFFSIVKKYNVCNIDKFEYFDQEKLNPFKRNTLNDWGIGNGNIRFRIDNETRYFGIRLYDFEALPIIEKLNIKLIELKNQNCV